jgi:hypothetical protein
MDPVTTAIVSAIAAGLARGSGAVAEGILPDAYRQLKELLRQRIADSGAVSTAIAELESRPDSNARVGVLVEEMATCGAAQDADLIAAARTLLDHIATSPSSMHLQNAEGSYIAQSDRHGHAEVRVNQPPAKSGG